MKISRNWLKEYISIEETDQDLGDMLTFLGFEVEEIEHISNDFDGIVTGHILECFPHPNADKLSLCKVDIGIAAPVQIACGANNVAQGQFVPVATVGAVMSSIILPNGSPLKIEKRKLRGEISEGMICAEDELGLSDDHGGIMVLNDSPKPGTPFREYYGAESDVVYEIALTPNRPDAACHYGIAREISAKTGRPIKALKQVDDSRVLVDSIGDFTVEIKNPDLCHRYLGIRIQNVEIKPSPKWLKNRMLSIGLRPINNVVDATNYILHTFGQPLHAFDADTLRGNKIVVQSFDSEQKFVTLDSIERKIEAGSLFIGDAEGPIALAGIMGGENSEISDSTKNVLLEGAYFFPHSIRQTSKNTALQTDASYRFERGIDPSNTHIYTWLCAELIADVAGGTIVSEYIDEHPTKPQSISIDFRPERCDSLLGISVASENQKNIFESLGIIVDASESVWKCIPPSHRVDLEREIDLIEEVARMIDYNSIPRPEFQSFLPATHLPKTELLRERIRELSVRLGYNEIYSNSLLPEHSSIVSETTVRTLNPISKDQSLLRESLLPGLLKAVSFNQKRKQTDIRFFEMGHVFTTDDKGNFVEGIREEEYLGFVISGNWTSADWTHNADSVAFKHLRSTIQSLFGALNILEFLHFSYSDVSKINISLILDSEKSLEIGYIQKIDPLDVAYFELNKEVYFSSFNLTSLYEVLANIEDRKYTSPSKFPEIEFDLALVMPKTTLIGDVTKIFVESAGSLLTSISTFDVFAGKNLGDDFKSVAFKMFFQDTQKTLTIDEVQPIIDTIVRKANQQFGAYLRQ